MKLELITGIRVVYKPIPNKIVFSHNVYYNVLRITF